MAIPVEETIVATEVVPLVHVPPADASVSAVVPPGHTDRPPVIAAGNGFIVITALLKHPDGLSV